MFPPRFYLPSAPPYKEGGLQNDKAHFLPMLNLEAPSFIFPILSSHQISQLLPRGISFVKD